MDGVGTHSPMGENGWLPIETAPKDVDVLVCLRDGSRFTARFVFDYVSREFGWADSYEGEEMEEPTHWQPLPNPPVLKEQGT